MVDYTRGTGSAGTMMIRDTGSVVEFWIRSADGATFSGGISWSGYINGTNVGGTFAYPSGSPWINVAGYSVGYTQDVRFSIGASGTMGLGGPTDFVVNIFRATVPAAPNTPTASAVGPDRMTLAWNLPANGGSGLDQMLLRRSTDPGFSTYTDYVNSGSTTSREVTGLVPGTTYYWRVYAHNAVGYSSPSGTLTQATLSGGRAWDGTAWRNCRVKQWNGTTWQLVRVRAWDGTQWRNTR